MDEGPTRSVTGWHTGELRLGNHGALRPMWFDRVAPTTLNVAISRSDTLRQSEPATQVDRWSSTEAEAIDGSMQPSQLDLQLARAFRDIPIARDRLAAHGVRRDIEKIERLMRRTPR